MKSNMVWRNQEARPLDVAACEELMGYPEGYTESLKPMAGKSKKMARRHAIGNGYHVPSIVVLLALLINPVARAAPVGA